MKAIAYSRYGGPEVLELREFPNPEPKTGEILIRVHAAEATKSDCELRSFQLPVRWYAVPLRLALGITRPRRPILGGYFSGQVVKLGTGATRFKPGDRVFSTW